MELMIPNTFFTIMPGLVDSQADFFILTRGSFTAAEFHQDYYLQGELNAT